MPPSVPFPKQTPSFEEFGNCVRRARNGSAPGPNGIPYVVWKYCPSLKRRLYTICQKVWSTGKTPTSWSQAVIVQFHKSGTNSDPTNFRPIALSNCDGKLFFSLLSKSFTSYMIRNEYFDKQTQKGFCLVSLAVSSTPAFHKKLYVMPGGIAARSALLG